MYWRPLTMTAMNEAITNFVLERRTTALSLQRRKCPSRLAWEVHTWKVAVLASGAPK